MVIRNGLVFTENYKFEPISVCTSDDLISKSSDNGEMIDADDCYVIPGLVDIHFHGAVGYDFCDGTKEAIAAIAEYEAAQGVTAIAPATMTFPLDTLLSIAGTAKSFAEEQKAGTASKNAADLVGINMEGPFISLAKKGAQNGEYIHKPSLEFYRKFQDASGNLVKLVDIAPEEEGALDFIKEVKDEVTVSIAHTTANYDIATKAFEAGARHVTHLYNAMPGFTHRESGVIGAAFDKESARVELICDGIHISPAVIRATFKLFGDDRVVMISDSMMACGKPDGKYALGGQDVDVKGALATLADGTIAGSVTNLMKCVRHAVSVGIPLESTIKAAAVNPAKAIGVFDSYGSLQIGKKANIVLLDKKTLEVRKIILNGKKRVM